MSRFLFDLVRSPVFARLAVWIFAHARFLLPVKILADTPTLVAFRHPSPSYPLHLLIVPKKAIPSLAHLTPEDAPILADVFIMARALAPGCLIVANAGAYQTVPWLHFHLVAPTASIFPDGPTENSTG